MACSIAAGGVAVGSVAAVSVACECVTGVGVGVGVGIAGVAVIALGGGAGITASDTAGDAAGDAASARLGTAVSLTRQPPRAHAVSISSAAIAVTPPLRLRDLGAASKTGSSKVTGMTASVSS